MLVAISDRDERVDRLHSSIELFTLAMHFPFHELESVGISEVLFVRSFTFAGFSVVERLPNRENLTCEILLQRQAGKLNLLVNLVMALH